MSRFELPIQTLLNFVSAWVKGITGMVEGETRQLLFPPRMGWGDSGMFTWGIPGNATLITGAIPFSLCLHTVSILRRHKASGVLGMNNARHMICSFNQASKNIWMYKSD